MAVVLNGGTFITAVNGMEDSVPEPISAEDRKRAAEQAYLRFRRVARVVRVAMSFVKFLTRILKKPIQWGWEHDPDAELFSKPLQRRKGKGRGAEDERKNHGVISTDFSVGQLFNTQKVFKGWLPESMRALFRKEFQDKTENDLLEMQIWSGGMKAFRDFQPNVQKMILKLGRYERWHGNRTIIKEGHKPMNFYVILDGEVEIARINKDLVQQHLRKMGEDGQLEGKDVDAVKEELEKVYVDILGNQSSGESFGELAFINEDIRLATVRTKRTTEFLLLGREIYESITSIAQDTDIREKMTAMREMPMFRTLGVNLNNLAHYVDVKTYPPNAVIVCEGDLCEYVYFLRSGTCRVIKAVPFMKIPVSRERYILKPLNDVSETDSGQPSTITTHAMTSMDTLSAEIRPRASTALASGSSAASSLSHTKIITKFLVVHELYPGDHFFDGDSSKTPRDLILASGLGTSASRTTVVANLKTEVLKIAKVDFNKFARAPTWQAFVETAENAIPSIEKLSLAYMDRRAWDVYKRTIVDEIVRRYKKRRRHKGDTKI
ncbi:hypothetical protein HK101_000339 [Irineochytrium annulatum]|nr:hypothetical protein HK101_000339 [Irineochytrium annulatum]